MYVLIVVTLAYVGGNAQQSVTMHDFESESACAVAALAIRDSLIGIQSAKIYTSCAPK
jgi:hypothetical protein